MNPLAEIQRLEIEARAAIARALSAKELEEVDTKYLGRKGSIPAILKSLKDLPVEERKDVGATANRVKDELSAEVANRIASLAPEARANFDYTLPGQAQRIGKLHPITQVLTQIQDTFQRLGFGLATGPEIETDYYNFAALNFPPDHPARDMQDTFFISEDKNILLRTHTSPVQIRVMEKQKPPVRVVIPGRVYRNEAINARSYCLFHQLEGLYVDEGVTFSELKGTLVAFAKQFYGSDVKYKFRPTFFPFTEPSADMYISCFLCGGKGCRLCKNVGWLEILGAGMVHPHVFDHVGYDTERYTGYAFGMGIERIALLRYEIDDIRLFYENDVRFLKQF